jgi:pyruvate dehydrogenase E2 component (dihydrolipoamide acetyltransferase)
MADRVTRSWTSAPHFFLIREANAGRLMGWRAGMQDQSEPRLTYTDLLVNLVAAALSRHPRINASWSNGTIITQPDINIGVAAAIEQGLVVPVIHRADKLTLSQIAARRQELVRRAQTGKLSVEDLANGTFTISNLGMHGVDVFLAIINPPQAAILAVGRIAERVVPVRGQPGVQPMMTLSLSCDHRVIDGAGGAQFLETLVRFIEEPMLLL